MSSFAAEPRFATRPTGTERQHPARKIGIYIESPIAGVGGSECVAAVMAEALGQHHRVEIVHHKRPFTIEQLAEFADTDLTRVSLRYVPPEAYARQPSPNLWRHYQSARKWHATVSQPYDLFIALVHTEPPFCHAPRGILMILFPVEELPHIGRRRHLEATNGRFWERLKLIYHDWEWRKRFETYQVKTANSRFTQGWTRRRWGIDCDVLYHPPINASFRVAEKADIILSVGRFHQREGASKKHVELLRVFQGCLNAGLRDWEYFSTGALIASPDNRAYYDHVQSLAGESGAHVIANIDRSHLRELYEQGKIFWHAAGYGDEFPEFSEHFGLVTVEAMAAGCVPIVINKGGQPEIVQHGLNGFLWNTLDELKEYTLLVARDEQLRARLAEAARSRAREFSRDRFVARLLEIVARESTMKQRESDDRAG